MSNTANEVLWGILSKSKDGNDYVSPIIQYLNLAQELKTVDTSLLKKLETAYRSLVEDVKSFKGFESLHASRGGIVEGGDDAFYLDFPAWVVAQGQELYTYAKSDGAKMIESYVSHYGISTRDLTFENLMYPFSPSDGKAPTADDFTNLILERIITSDASVFINPLYASTFDPENLVAFRFTYDIPRQVRGNSKVYWSVDVLVSDLTSKQRLLILNKVSGGDVLLRPFGDLYLSKDEYDTGLHALSFSDKYTLETLLGTLYMFHGIDFRDK